MFDNSNLVTIFMAGLFTGGLTCMAVQGGLLTATLAQHEEEKLTLRFRSGQEAMMSRTLPVFSFLIAKLIVYTLLGFFLGWLGSLVQVSLQVRIFLQFAVVLFMFGTGLNLLKVHPIFRYFNIQPPRFLTRIVRSQSKRKDLPAGKQIIFAPALLGAFTIFIPCGTTQAMMALAIGSGNPIVGAVILFTFVLGTSPLFFLLGYMTMSVGDLLKSRFTKIAAFAILFLALFNLDATLSLSGTEFTIGNLVKDSYCILSYCEEAPLPSPVDNQTITFTPTGYTPNNFTVAVGSKVTLHLVNQNATGCLQAFTISSLDLQKMVLPNSSRDVVFTAPSKPTKITFTCSQGLYPGTINVI